MRITFGIFLDEAKWHDGWASLGCVRLGPCGLLSLLETRLGLTGPDTHPALRINQYLTRVNELSSLKDEHWFLRKSFEADSWSTAKQMLAWRDELIEAGWNGKPFNPVSPRLKELSDLENMDIELSPGKS